MKKALICIFATLGSILLIFGAAVAMFAFGVFPTDWTEKIYSAIIDSSYYMHIGEPALTPNVLEPEQITIQAPDDMIGLYIDADEEYPLSSFSDVTSFCNKVESDLIVAQSIYMNTCYFEMYSDVSPLTLSNADGSTFDANEYIASLCRTYSLDLILVFDSDYLKDSQGEYSFTESSRIIEALSPEGVMYSERTLYSEGDWLTFARRFASDVNASFSNMYFGIEVWNKASKNEAGQTVYSTQNMQSLVDDGLVDFIYIEAYNAIHDNSLPFSVVYSWWDSYAVNYPDIMFYCEHRNDRVCTDSSSWNVYNEIASQLKALRECLHFNGSSFYSATAVAENKSTSTQRIAVHYTEGDEEYMHVETISLDREKHTVYFTGNASSYYKLVLNGEPLAPSVYSSGEFSLTFDLIPGMNTFSFEQCGRNLTYRIYSKLELVDSFYPTESIILNEGESITVKAVCPSTCSVYCILNDEKFDMVPDASVSPDTAIPDGYSVFSRTFTASGAGYEATVIGTPAIVASLDGTNEEHTCGRVEIAAAQQKTDDDIGVFLNKVTTYIQTNLLNTQQIDNNETTTQLVTPSVPDNTGKDNEVSPFTDYGLGEELVCRIRYENVERFSYPDNNNSYHPDMSLITSGTLDYVKEMTVSGSGFIRYKLESGATVKAISCELLCGSYRMPQNNLNVLSCDSDKDGFTKIILDSDWIVPLNISLHPIDFSTGYLEGVYNVSEFSPEYLDIEFSYTDGITGLDNLTFSESSIFSSYQILDNEDNYILRLTLKEKGKFYGYESDTDDYGNFVLTFLNRQENSIDGKVVVLDPGHGSLSMTGTANSANNVVEKDVNLQMSLKVRDMLEDMGATVILTRESDIPLSLGERTDVSDKENPDIFVSLHCDGSDYSSESGTHTFYYSSFSMPLAKCIHDSLVETYKTKIYYSSAYETQYNKVDKKIKFYPFQVTRISNCPSVLVEMGFLTNSVEWQVLADENCQLWLARAISDGINNYFINY